jgi:hypothetical protein
LSIYSAGSDDRRIFRNGSSRFGEWLCRILKQNENSFDADVEDTITEGHKRQTGSHSVRKGAYTFLQTILEGPLGGPTQQRAGWASGGSSNQAVILNMSTVIIYFISDKKKNIYIYIYIYTYLFFIFLFF